MNYDCNSETVGEYTYTSSKYSNRYGNQTFSNLDYIYGWRVLGVSDDGNIELIADDFLNKTFTINGGKGTYLHGDISETIYICRLYAKGVGAVAGRCVNLSDINKLTGYDPTMANYGINTTYEYGNIVQYSFSTEDAGIYAEYSIRNPITSNNMSGKVKMSGHQFAVPSVGCSWSGGSWNSDITNCNKTCTIKSFFYEYFPETLTENESDEEKGLSKDSEAYKLLFTHSSTGSKSGTEYEGTTQGMSYMLCSEANKTYVSSVDTYIFKVYNGKITGDLHYDSKLNNYVRTEEIRPVITLSENIIMKKVGTNENGTNIWDYTVQTPYKIEHYKQNEDKTGYELTETEELTGTAGEIVTAVAKKYEDFKENTTYGDRVASGTIAEDGSLVLKLYYDRVVKQEFNIVLNKKSIEDNIELQGATYDVMLKYEDSSILEYNDNQTNEEGKITISNVVAKDKTKIYYKETQAPIGYVLDNTLKYVEIKVNQTTNEVELTGSKTNGVFAYIEDNTLYIQETNYMENVENVIRINSIDNIDNDIKLSKISFKVYYPDGTERALVTDEDGIAELTGISAPGVGTFEYEIVQQNTVNGYIEDVMSKYVNITFDESGIITAVEALSRDINANKIEENKNSCKYVIANIDMLQNRGSSNEDTVYSDYTIKIIEKDEETLEVIEGVKYKIIQECVNNSMTTTTTTKKTTNANGEAMLEALNGNELTISLRRTAVPETYKLEKELETITLIKTDNSNYELTSEIDNVTIDNDTKTITVNRTSIKTTSSKNEAKSKSNMTFYITKVDELLRPLQGVNLELREETTGNKWKLKTDDNGLAKLSSQDLINTLGTEYPEYLNEAEGKLVFWITEETVPQGYELINGDIGFEIYYEITPEGILEISTMNVLDGISYTHILNQEYNQYEKEDYMQADIYMKVINYYDTTVEQGLKTLQIEKVEEDNEEIKLKEASFQVTLNYPTSGKVRGQYTTNSNGLININKLYFPEGTTTIEIVEKIAPTGYVLNNVPTTVKVTNEEGVITVEGGSIENEVVKVRIVNTKKEYEQTYSLVVEKRDSNTKELIDSAAEFNVTITNTNSSIQRKICTNNGKASLYGLNGKGLIQIDIEETNAPIGYKLNSTVKTVYITKESFKSSIELDNSKEQNTNNVRIVGNTIYVTVEDEPNNTEPYLVIHKTDKKNTKLALKDAKFVITMPNGGTRTLTTNKYGNIVISLENKISGRYIIQETKAPSGYVLGKNIAIDIIFDEDGNISSANIVKDLGDEYTSEVVGFSTNNNRIYVSIGNEPTEYNRITSYSIKIDKVSSLNNLYKLDGAKFDINIEQENGNNYSLTETTEYERGINIYGLSGTGNIKISLQELEAPSGYVYDGTVKEITFSRDEITKQLTLNSSGLANINEEDIEVNNINHTITIKISNAPKRYTPIIKEDGSYDLTIVEGNSIIIENEDINNHNIKIEGTTFKISKQGTYISKGTTNERGITTISLGSLVYTTTVDYLIENTDMTAHSYIKNDDVVLRITYDSKGKMQDAEIVQGETTKEGIIAAEIDENFNYKGNNTIKIDIRCKKKAYTSVTNKDVLIKNNPTISPITPIEIKNGLEPDFGITLEKVNVYNNRIKVADAKYTIYVTNEETGETISNVTTTNSNGKINVEGLLGFGNYTIKIVEIDSPDGYALDEYKHTLRIYRD